MFQNKRYCIISLLQPNKREFSLNPDFWGEGRTAIKDVLWENWRNLNIDLIVDNISEFLIPLDVN